MFRQEAVQRYVQGREAPAPAGRHAPRTGLLLWTLCALALAGFGIVASAQVPEYASGFATVVRLPGSGQTALAALLPAEARPRLHPGQPALLSLHDDAQPVIRPMGAVHPGVLGPDSARALLRLGGAASARLTRPVAVAFLPHPAAPGALGSVYTLRVQTGTRRLASFFPRLP